jgi:hypothetical protein
LPLGEIAHQKTRLVYCKENHFIKDEMISKRHPDFDVLAPIIININKGAKNDFIGLYAGCGKNL